MRALRLSIVLASALAVCSPARADDVALTAHPLDAPADPGWLDLVALRDGTVVVTWSIRGGDALTGVRVDLDAGTRTPVETADPALTAVDDLEPVGDAGFVLARFTDDRAWLAAAAAPDVTPRPLPAVDVQTSHTIVQLDGLLGVDDALLVFEEDRLLRLDARGAVEARRDLPGGELFGESEPVMWGRQAAIAAVEKVRQGSTPDRLVVRRLDPADLDGLEDVASALPTAANDLVDDEVELLVTNTGDGDDPRLGVLYVGHASGAAWLGEADATTGEVPGWTALDEATAGRLVGARLQPMQGAPSPTSLVAHRADAAPARLRLVAGDDGELALEADVLSTDGDGGAVDLTRCTETADRTLVCVGQRGNEAVLLLERGVALTAAPSPGVWTTWTGVEVDTTAPAIRPLAAAIDAWCAQHGDDDTRCGDLVGLFTPPERTWERSDWTVLTDLEAELGAGAAFDVVIERDLDATTAVRVRFVPDPSSSSPSLTWTVESVDDVVLPDADSRPAEAVEQAVRAWCAAWSSPWCRPLLDTVERETWAPARLRTRRPFRVTVTSDAPDEICTGELLVHPDLDDAAGWLVQGIATDCPLYE